MKLLITLAILLLAATSWGQVFEQPITKYNAMEDRFEITYPSSQLRYNAMEDTFQFVSPPPIQRDYSPNPVYIPQGPVFNPFSGRFEYPK
jgi:hypothetical protein